MGTNEMFKETMNSLFEGMDGYLSTKTVVSEPVVIGDTTLIPLVNVSFGLGAGALRSKEHADAAGGIGGKMSPSAVIVIKNNSARVINISTNTGFEKLIDMVPDLVATIQGKMDSKGQSKEAREAAKEVVSEILDEATE